MRSDIKEVRPLETSGFTGIWGWMALAPDTGCWSMQIAVDDMLIIAGLCGHTRSTCRSSREDQKGPNQLIHGLRHGPSLISKDTARGIMFYSEITRVSVDQRYYVRLNTLKTKLLLISDKPPVFFSSLIKPKKHTGPNITCSKEDNPKGIFSSCWNVFFFFMG